MERLLPFLLAGLLVQRLEEDYVGGFTCVRSPFYGVPAFLVPFFLPYIPIVPRVWKILKKVLWPCAA